MTLDNHPVLIGRLIELVSEMTFSVGFSSGLEANGLAVPLLAVVSTIFIRSKPHAQNKLVDLARVLLSRPSKKISKSEN